MAKSEDYILPNGKTIRQTEEEVNREIENIYLEGWSKGVSIPFWDKEGNFYLANPDGSEDLVSFDMDKRKYTVLSRIAEAGKGRYAYLLNRANKQEGVKTP